MGYLLGGQGETVCPSTPPLSNEVRIETGQGLRSCFMLMMNFGKNRYHTCSIMYTICYSIHVSSLQYFEMHIAWYVCV